MQLTAVVLGLLASGAGAFLAPAAGTKGLLQRAPLAQRYAASPLYGKPKLTDMLDELDDEDDGKPAAKKAAEAKVELEPEVVFYEGPPAKSEMIAPALSVFTVIGVIPFSAALIRQAWVRYTVTSRRIRVQSGYQGQDETELVYSDIKSMKFAWRNFGAAGDIVLELRDGARVEMRSLPDFENLYKEIYSRCSEEAQEESDTMKSKDA